MSNTLQFLRLGLLSLVVALAAVGSVSADVLQWRTRVPSGVTNPNSIGSYVNTFEMGNGGTTGYDPGLDIDLDTSLMPNDQFFVNYTPLGGNKVEYDFTPFPQIGDTYTSRLSFENRIGGSVSVANTIDFLSMDLTNNPNGVNDFSYTLQLDTNNSGSYDSFRTGTVSSILGQATPELPSWNQTIASGLDHSTGFYYGELTLTAIDSLPPPTPTPTLEWIRQLGTSEDEISYGVATDVLGNVYITGFTRGSLDGANAGGADAFVSKYDTSGTLEWTRQLGTGSTEISGGVATDSLGNVYISGYTDGSLDGANAGGFDAFVSKSALSDL